MTKPFFYFTISILSLCLILSTFLTITYFNSKKKLESLHIELNQNYDSLNTVIKSRDEEIEFLQNEIQEREIEIMYWGMKYDSTTWKN
jgi:hypothetical protein